MSGRAPLTAGLMALLAVCIAPTSAALHYVTPILPELGRTFALSPAEVGLIPTLCFAGFFAGNLLLVPLGDVMEKKRLVVAKLAGLLLAQAVIGLAWSFPVLLAACFVAGVCSSVSQDIVATVSELAEPGARGKALGTVLTGLFIGILSGRMGGGWIGEQFGWRSIYALSVVLLLAALVAMALRLPRTPIRTAMPYVTLLGTLVTLYVRRADVRRASLTQFCIGIGYGGFWATLAPMLALLHGLGPAAAGMMAIPGAAGILAARPAGRLMDRHGARPVALTGAALVLGAYVIFGAAALTIAALVVGAMLLDFGLRAALVANQTLVTGADPESRSRANSIFASHIWGGNAAGALAASSAFAAFGWWGVCVVGAVGAACAFALQAAAPRRAAAG